MTAAPHLQPTPHRQYPTDQSDEGTCVLPYRHQSVRMAQPLCGEGLKVPEVAVRHNKPVCVMSCDPEHRMLPLRSVRELLELTPKRVSIKNCVLAFEYPSFIMLNP